MERGPAIETIWRAGLGRAWDSTGRTGRLKCGPGYNLRSLHSQMSSLGLQALMLPALKMVQLYNSVYQLKFWN